MSLAINKKDNPIFNHFFWFVQQINSSFFVNDTISWNSNMKKTQKLILFSYNFPKFQYSNSDKNAILCKLTKNSLKLPSIPNNQQLTP